MSLFLEDIRFKSQSFELADGFLSLEGLDAENYLNSQTTNNISNLTNGNFHFNSVLDLSGKIISSFILLKVSSSELRIIVPNDLMDATLDRIEKFHISEDFETVKVEQKVFLNMNSAAQNFRGQYFFEGDCLSFEKALHTLGNHDDLETLTLLTGVPRLGVEAESGDLINNTYLDELSVDYKKGCFPGQETVAKIHTRRGAAYKPVLGISSEKYDEVVIDDKKVGRVLFAKEINGQWFHYLSLLRNYRVDKTTVGPFEIHYFPYVSITKKEMAEECFDIAVEYFQSGDNEAAKKYFYRAIEFNPLFEDAYESLGVLYGRLENYSRAIELMEDLKELNPKSMMAYTNLSLYHMKLGQIDIAEDFKSQATLLNFELLGDEAERKQKQQEIAAKKLADRDRREGMFKQVLEMDPEDVMANNGMGEILLEKQLYAEAKTHFEIAIKFDKKYSVAYLGLAKCLVQLNEKDELISILKLGIEVAGKNGDLMPANEMQSLLIAHS